MMDEELLWVDASRSLPSELGMYNDNILLAFNDGRVFAGWISEDKKKVRFLNDGGYIVTADLEKVEYWAAFPAPPRRK